MVTPANHVIAQRGFILCGAMGSLVIFATFFAYSNIGEYQKNVSPSERGAPSPVPYYGKSGPSYCFTSIKRLDEGLR